MCQMRFRNTTGELYIKNITTPVGAKFISKFVESVHKQRLKWGRIRTLQCHRLIVEGFVTYAQNRIAIISLSTVRYFCHSVHKSGYPWSHVLSGVSLVLGAFQGIGMSRGWYVQELVGMSGGWTYPGGGYLSNTRYPPSSYPNPILARLGTHLILGPGVDTDTDAPYECPRCSFQKPAQASTLVSMPTLGVGRI